MITARDELIHAVSTFSEAEAEQALEVLNSAGLLDEAFYRIPAALAGLLDGWGEGEAREAYRDYREQDGDPADPKSFNAFLAAWLEGREEAEEDVSPRCRYCTTGEGSCCDCV